MKPLLLALTLASTTALAFPAGELLFTTRDGRTLRGRILAETAQGYLVAGPASTELLPFTSLVDLRPAELQAPPAVPLPPPPPSPVPLTIANPRLPSPEEEEAEARARRLGLHVGLGGGAMVIPVGLGVGYVNVQLHLDWTFGTVGLRLSPTVGHFDAPGEHAFVFSTDLKAHFNLGDLFALGVGLELGGWAGLSSGFFVGPSFAPAIFKLGLRGQHQLSLQVTVPLLRVTTPSSSFGTPLGALGYSYLF